MSSSIIIIIIIIITLVIVIISIIIIINIFIMTLIFPQTEEARRRGVLTCLLVIGFAFQDFPFSAQPRYLKQA